MKLKLAAAIFALVAIPELAFGQQPPKTPKPTKADVQKVAQIISSNKAKLQSYCDLKKLYEQMGRPIKRTIARRLMRSTNRPRRWSVNSVPNTRQ